MPPVHPFPTQKQHVLEQQHTIIFPCLCNLEKMKRVDGNYKDALFEKVCVVANPGAFDVKKSRKVYKPSRPGFGHYTLHV